MQKHAEHTHVVCKSRMQESLQCYIHHMVAAVYKDKLNQELERPTKANHDSSNISCYATDWLGHSWSNNCILKVQTKMSAYIFEHSQRHRRQRKSKLYSTLVGRRRPGYIQQLDIHKEGGQKKACHYLRIVQESTGTKDESSNSQIYNTKNMTRTRWASGRFYFKTKNSNSKMSISW